MSSKYTEAFDSLRSDDDTKSDRAKRVLSSHSAGAEQRAEQQGATSIAKVRRHVFAGKRGVALITAIAVFVAAVAIAVPIGISIHNSGGLLSAMSLLEDTYVDMNGVTAFGVWNAPESAPTSAKPTSAYISDVSYIHTSSYSADENESGRADGLDCENEADDNTTNDTITPTDTSTNDNANDNKGDNKGDNTDDEQDSVISGDWSDEDRYEWESDYDWDPTKANVLIAIDEDGNISEVVYERTNGRGQVRQDVLGNATAVYVSNGFTYVMYVNDDVWEYRKNSNLVYQTFNATGFGCHHEREQTVVIHNETGKVFALKDIIPQVNELSGATNYTMIVDPFKNDLLCVIPMYGNLIPQWFNVIYDEKVQKIRYEFILPPDSDVVKSYSLGYHVRAVRRDKYGQHYLLEGNAYEGVAYNPPRVSAGIVNLPSYACYDNALVFSTPNGMMLGTDGRMYAFDDGKLKVFGENFELLPVEAGTKVAFEGVADDFEIRFHQVNDSISYKLEGGYLYSMFGEVWKVDDDGTMHARDRLEGSFPRFADDGYLMGGEIIAFVDTELTDDGKGSMNGRMVQISFESTSGSPCAVITHILDASEISVNHYRMVFQQNERPNLSARGETKYFLLTVQDGKVNVEYFAYGYDANVLGITNPTTEPVVMSNR